MKMRLDDMTSIQEIKQTKIYLKDKSIIKHFFQVHFYHLYCTCVIEQQLQQSQLRE